MTKPISKSAMKLPAAAMRADVREQAKSLYLEKLKERQGRAGQACQLANVALQTVQYWRREDPDFRLDEQEIQLLRDDSVREAMDDLVKDKNPSVVIAASKRLPEFREARDRKLTVQGRIDHVHGLTELTDDQKAALVTEAAKVIELEQKNGDTYE